MVDLESSLEQITTYKEYAKGYLCRCPFAPKTHSKKFDRSPSLVVWPEINRFVCYSCGQKGKIKELFLDLARLIPTELHEQLANKWQDSLYHITVKLKNETERETIYLNEEILEHFPPVQGKGKDYLLLNRGVAEEAILHYNIRWDDRSKRVVFPLRDRAGRLLGLVGRNIEKKEVRLLTRRKNKLVFGVGINDVDYFVSPKGESKCPLYVIWKSMLGRCYYKTYQALQPTYQGCFACEDWKRLSKFRDWTLSQNWEGRELDKDLLIPGNKEYAPDKCLFVSQRINNFFKTFTKADGLPVGISRRGKKFLVRCGNPISGEMERIGLFINMDEAFNTWNSRRKEIAFELADLEDDTRVQEAIVKRWT